MVIQLDLLPLMSIESRIQREWSVMEVQAVVGKVILRPLVTVEMLQRVVE